MGKYGQKPACPIGQLIAEYEDGASGRELAKKYDVSFQAIYSRLRNAGVVPRKRGGQHGYRISLPIAELVKRYEAGESTYMLATAYGIRQQLIWKRLREAGCQMRKHTHAKVSNEHLRADYALGLTAQQCADKHGMARQVIYRRWWGMGLRRYKEATNGTR